MRFDSPKALTKFIRQNRPNWARGITIHHTGIPCLETMPDGFTDAYIGNLPGYYRSKGWKGMPHFFVDHTKSGWITFGDDQPLTRRGVHAKSFNKTHIGIEMLGNYDKEDPVMLGPGSLVLLRTQHLCALICKEMGWDPEKAINFHRDDPLTNKTCPGAKVKKADFIQGVIDCLKEPIQRSRFTVFTPGGEFEEVVDHEGRPTVPARLFAKRLGSMLPITLIRNQVFFGIFPVPLAWRDEGGAAWVNVRDAAEAMGWGVLFDKSVILVMRAPR